MKQRVVITIAAIISMGGAPRLAGAKDTAAASASPDEAKKAKALFTKGKAAFKAKDFVAAAQSFEQAYQLKPHHDVLWNAARSRHEADQPLDAANLYAKYLREAPDDAKDRDEAIRNLKEISAKLGKIEVHTAPTVKEPHLDGKPYGGFAIYVTPGEHTAAGKLADGKDDGKDVRSTISVAAGQSASLNLEPPPPPKIIRKIEVRDKGLPWPVVAVGGGLTLVAGGLTIWSGLNTNAKKQEFTDAQKANAYDPKLQGMLDDGRSAQTRTNILLVTTGVLAVATGVLAYFVNWKALTDPAKVDPKADPKTDLPSASRLKVRLGVGSVSGTF
jgi:tetratricopeptide (TPR) repeat protein